MQRTRLPLLRAWALRVVLPLSLAVVAAFVLMAWGAAQSIPDDAARHALLWRCGGLLLLALAVVAVVGLGIARRVVHPIIELTDAI